MKRNRPSREVLAEAGIFNAVGLSRWAEAHSISGAFLRFKRSKVTGGIYWEFHIKSKGKIDYLSAGSLSKVDALSWVLPIASHRANVDTWARIEGLTELFPYSTLKEFKNHYPDAIIAKVS